MRELTLVALPDVPEVRAGDSLCALVLRAIDAWGRELQSGDVLILAQKIVSKAEGRHVNLSTLTPSPRALEVAAETGKDARLVEVILQDSRSLLRARPGLIIVEHRLGFVCANAGVDHSNVDSPDGSDGEWVLRLPADPDRSAAELRHSLEARSGVAPGVLITDSHGRAWRLGTVGVALGAAGFPTLLDLRGQPDLFNYQLQATVIGLADEIAAGASALMGQAAEGRPVVHVRGLSSGGPSGRAADLIRPLEEDLFR